MRILGARSVSIFSIIMSLTLVCASGGFADDGSRGEPSSSMPAGSTSPSGGLTNYGSAAKQASDANTTVANQNEQAQKQMKQSQVQSYLSGGMSVATGGITFADGQAECASGLTGCGFSGWAKMTMGVLQICMGLYAIDQAHQMDAPINDTKKNACDFGGCKQAPTLNSDNPLAPPAGTGLTDKHLAAMGIPSPSNLLPKNMKYDPKKKEITTPDGKTLKLSDFSSPSAMQAAGFSKEAIDKAMASVDKINQISAQRVANMDMGDDGGGGSFANAKLDGLPTPNLNLGLGSDGAHKLAERAPTAALDGLTKNFNGVPIGVAMDSIFVMMNRRYQLKQSQGYFFNPMANKSN